MLQTRKLSFFYKPKEIVCRFDALLLDIASTAVFHPNVKPDFHNMVNDTSVKYSFSNETYHKFKRHKSLKFRQPLQDISCNYVTGKYNYIKFLPPNTHFIGPSVNIILKSFYFSGS